MAERADWVSRKWLLVWFLVCAAASSAWCVAAGARLGPTWDEPFYLEAGLRAWHQLNPRELLQAGCMPLPPAVETLPLLVGETLRGRPINLDAEFDTWLPVARVGTLVFWWVLLASGCWLARRWGGPTAAALAVAFLAAEPILLGHASLVTTDLALAACLLLSLAVFEAGRDRGWLRRVLLPAGVAGLALLAKVSALVFGPVCLAVVELGHLLRPASTEAGGATVRRRWLRATWDLVQIGILAMIPVLVFCRGFRALHAIAFQVGHNTQGHGRAFLLGEISEAGFLHYFLMTVLIKVGLPVLVLGLIVVAVRPRRSWNVPLLAGLALLALSPGYRLQIGIRFVLPAVALLIVGVAIALARWLDGLEGRWRRRAWAAVGGALCWSALGAVQVWPHGLCFTNELWGGTAKGYLALSDSNYDWGQGLRELAAWQARHRAVPLDVWYFGNDPALKRFAMRPVELLWVPSAEELQARERGRYLAVGTTYLHGGLSNFPVPRFLQGRQPIARTTTFLIYDFTQPPEPVAGAPDW
ncbi:MAG: hypothetical protein IT429_05195 [Gemmataceae bacterium]|nr:hypothetical protein [Gemmataceae bacterium]